MPDLALSDALIDEYLKYKFQDTYNTNRVRKLFKYIQPFAMRENNSWMSDPSMPLQLENDPLIEIVDTCTDEELVQNTLLKFMITDNHSTTNYKMLNINDTFEKLQPKYGATYPNARDKNKAQEHIKFLLSDANWIKITDGYIATPRIWRDNKRLLSDIIPNIHIDLIIIGADKTSKKYILSQSEENELKSLMTNLKNIKAFKIDINTHDRYIETNRLKILLSSGLEHLSSSSNKDFTYIVESKQ